MKKGIVVASFIGAGILGMFCWVATPGEDFYSHQFTRLTSINFPASGVMKDYSYLPGPRGKDHICGVFIANEKDMVEIIVKTRSLQDSLPENSTCSHKGLYTFSISKKIDKPHDKQSGTVAIDQAKKAILFNFTDG